MQRSCLKCGHAHPNASGGATEACPRCGAVYAKLESLLHGGGDIRRVQVATPEQRDAAAAQSRQLDEQDARAAALRHLQAIQATGAGFASPPPAVTARALAVIVTTTAFVPGREVLEICGVVAHDTAHAFGAVFEEFAGLLRNVVGSGHSAATSKLLTQSRTDVLAGLRLHAMILGADAVIDVKFDYEEFSGANGHGVIVVVGTGTAVRLSRPTVTSAAAPTA